MGVQFCQRNWMPVLFFMYESLIGQRFERLLVISQSDSIRIGVKKKKRRAWLCKCDCGNQIILTGLKLKSGNTRSCGCLKAEGPHSRGQLENLINKRFGKLVVSEYVGRNRHNSRLWLCLCDCGEKRIIPTQGLKNRHHVSCGCMKSGRIIKLSKTHGLSHTKEFKCWEDMRGRCFNPNNRAYKYYGGRGITVCRRWANSFENFFKDMGKKPNDDYTIERNEVNGDYKKNNCKWIHKSLQSKNTTRSRFIEHEGQRMILQDWAIFFGVNKSTLVYHLTKRTMSEIFVFYKKS